MKTIYVIFLIVILSVSTVAAAIAGFKAVNSQEGIIEPTSNPTPPPSTILLPQPLTAATSTEPTVQTQAQQTTSDPTNQTANTTVPVVSIKDVSYGTDSQQEFDLYIPQNVSTPIPLIIFMHGGAWVAGDKADVSDIAIFLACQDFMVINMNYRVLPDFSYPAPMEDIQMVLGWVSQNAEKYKIDVAHIGMSGYSAGGHLATLYALTQDRNYIDDANTLPKVSAVASLAGCYTLEDIENASAIREDTIIEWLQTANPQTLGLPIYQIESSDNVSFLLLHGGQDVNLPASQSMLFYQALVDAGIPAQLKIYPERHHSDLISGIPSNDEVAEDLVAFFNKNLESTLHVT